LDESARLSAQVRRSYFLLLFVVVLKAHCRKYFDTLPSLFLQIKPRLQERVYDRLLA
jgi:hypothetical protein